MPPRRPRPLHGSTPRVVAALLTLTGFGVGILVGWFVVGKWDADWVGAIGQWFGGLATAAAVLWAVHVFRAEQENVREERRERARELAVAEAKEEAVARERKREPLRQASLVLVRLHGGAAHGGPGVWILDTVHILVSNGSMHSVTELELGLDEGSFVSPVPALFLQPQSEKRYQATVHEGLLVSSSEVSDQPLKVIKPVVTFRIDGRRWRRVGSAEPVLLTEGP